jgi:phenylpropionate dioxygenase-like ring-hydroxylating dioxygenase large terminal subunit
MSAYLKNAWYAAAWSPEIGRQLFKRVIMDESILFYRKEDGTAVAMSNRCAHRFAPLHLGKLEGDTVACPYHGLRYESSGKCVFNPNGDQRVPPARLKTYPLVERDGTLWIWPGDPALADPAQVADVSYLEDRTRYAPVTGYLSVHANYRFILDNLLDNAHLNTVHHDTLGCDSFRRAVPHLRPSKGNPNAIWTSLAIPSGLPGAIWSQIWAAEHDGAAPGPMDHWVELGWEPGGTCLQETGLTPAGRPRSEGIETLNCHFVTPETETTSHYFWGIARPFQLNNPELDVQMKFGANYAFQQQDEPMLEAIQKESGAQDFWKMRPALITEDISLSKVRRRMDELIKAENAATASATAATG